MKLTGSDHDLNFKYKYESSAGHGVNVYVIGMFLSLMIERISVNRIQQTLVSSSSTPPSKDVPRGGRPLARTRTRTEMGTELTVLEPLFLALTVLLKPPTSSL